jgi:uncharacterized protein (DUF1330 family)
MTAYAIAHMRRVAMGPAIVEYLERIDATLTPYGGRFIVHGGDFEEVEGSWPGATIVIELPDRRQVSAWYRSPAYREIAPLRTDNSDSDIILIDGVDAGHRATDVLTASP